MRSILHYQRLLWGYTQAELGHMIGRSGTFIARLERGEAKSITPEDHRRLAEALQIPIAQIRVGR